MDFIPEETLDVPALPQDPGDQQGVGGGSPNVTATEAEEEEEEEKGGDASQPSPGRTWHKPEKHLTDVWTTRRVPGMNLLLQLPEYLHSEQTRHWELIDSTFGPPSHDVGPARVGPSDPILISDSEGPAGSGEL